MTKHTFGALAVVALLASLAAAAWWFQESRSTARRFAGHLGQERYEEAARMLLAPSALERTPDGGLVVTDHAGGTTVVLATQLPFVVSEGHPAGPDHDLEMVALGTRTDGVLDTPAVTLLLRVDDGRVRIVDVQP